MPNILDEYLVKLGATVDAAGFARFHQALREANMAVTANVTDMAKALFKAQAEIVGGFAAIGGAALGLADKVAMADQEYRLFALHMFMSKDAARSLKVAMDALGQPLENLWWDPELAARTRQLIADQKAMAPDGDFEAQMLKIRDVRFEFTRMGVEAQYLGMHVIQDFMKALGMGPDDLLTKLREFNNWVTTHLPEISRWVVTNFLPIWRDVEMIFKDIAITVRDFATLFDNVIALFSGDGTLKGVATFDKFARSVEKVVHALAMVADFLVKIEGLITGAIGGGSLGGMIGSIAGGIAGIPAGPAGIAAGIIGGGATGTAIGGGIGAASGGVFDLLRHYKVGPWADNGQSNAIAGLMGGPAADGVDANAVAQQAILLAQQVSDKTGVRADLLWSQWAHETGGFTHIAAANNLAGINVPGGNGSQYRSFNSLSDFGDYYAGMVSRNFPDLKRATNADQFASILKNSGRLGAYYTGPESAYAGGMSRFDNAYNSAGGGDVHIGSIVVHIDKPGATNEHVGEVIANKIQQTQSKRVQRNLAEFQDLSYGYGG